MVGTPVASSFFPNLLLLGKRGDVAEWHQDKIKGHPNLPSRRQPRRDGSDRRGLRARCDECQQKFRANRASCYLKRVVSEDVRVLLACIVAGEKKAWDAFAEEYSPRVQDSGQIRQSQQGR